MMETEGTRQNNNWFKVVRVCVFVCVQRYAKVRRPRSYKASLRVSRTVYSLRAVSLTYFTFRAGRYQLPSTEVSSGTVDDDDDDDESMGYACPLLQLQ